MSSPKGYPTGSKLDRSSSQFATVEPVKQDQYGMSVLAHQFVYEVGTDAVDSATTYVITAASHAALKGDLIRFTSGTHANREVKVESVSTNTITLAETLSAAPAAAVTFQILRHKAPLVDEEGILQTTSIVPAGAATEAKQDVGNASLASIDGKVSTAAKQDTGNTSLASIDTKVATAAKQDTGNTSLSSIDTKVATAAKQDTGNTSLSSIDGKVSTAANQVTGNTYLNSIDGKMVFCDTTDVEITASALPTGAATEAKQDTGNTSLASIDGKITACNTGAVTISSSALPTGAATEATLSAASAKLPATLGQKAMSASLAVALASDQSAIPASQSGTWTVQPGNTANSTAWLTRHAGKSKANAPVRNDYSSVNVTTGAYVQLVASTTSLTTEIEIFDSSGQTLALAVGGLGSEVDQIYIIPGGNGRIPLAIPASSRVSVKAISANATAGELVINFYA